MAKEEFVCEWCGETDEYYPTWENGKFCSERCMGDYMADGNAPLDDPQVAKKVSETLSGRSMPHMRGENNPAKRPEVRRKISESNKGSTPWNKGISLSEEIRQNMSDNHADFSGSNHPRWTGGYDPYYGPSWTEELRETIRDRDDRECQSCGVSEDDLGKRLDVHHITPFRKFGVDSHDEANDPDNLISLCHSCHMRQEDWNAVLQ